ncbi:hypothetical protein DAI22_09g062601 [Oryza sativa Japonica Group]|nr:hypothetical protein DAI22_09g062601 [Oryza sativa Japonica Group]
MECGRGSLSCGSGGARWTPELARIRRRDVEGPETEPSRRANHDRQREGIRSRVRGSVSLLRLFYLRLFFVSRLASLPPFSPAAGGWTAEAAVATTPSPPPDPVGGEAAAAGGEAVAGSAGLAAGGRLDVGRQRWARWRGGALPSARSSGRGGSCRGGGLTGARWRQVARRRARGGDAVAADNGSRRRRHRRRGRHCCPGQRSICALEASWWWIQILSSLRSAADPSTVAAIVITASDGSTRRHRGCRCHRLREKRKAG